MMKNLCFFLLFSLFFGACGDFFDNLLDDNKKDGLTDSEINEKDLRRVLFLNLVADLPKCTSTLEGSIFYIKEDNSFKTCKANKWNKINLTGPAGLTIAADLDSRPACEEAIVNTLSYVTSEDTLNKCSLVDNKYTWVPFDLTGPAGLTIVAAEGNLPTCEDAIVNTLYYATEQQSLNKCSLVNEEYTWAEFDLTGPAGEDGSALSPSYATANALLDPNSGEECVSGLENELRYIEDSDTFAMCINDIWYMSQFQNSRRETIGGWEILQTEATVYVYLSQGLTNGQLGPDPSTIANAIDTLCDFDLGEDITGKAALLNLTGTNLATSLTNQGVPDNANYYYITSEDDDTPTWITNSDALTNTTWYWKNAEVINEQAWTGFGSEQDYSLNCENWNSNDEESSAPISSTMTDAKTFKAQPYISNTATCDSQKKIICLAWQAEGL